MNTKDDVINIVNGLDASDLDHWIDNGWVQPTTKKGQSVFAEVDIARVRLIVEFRIELGIDESNMPVVLSLMDQLYSTRRDLRLLTTAVEQQSSATKEKIFAAMTTPNRDS